VNDFIAEFVTILGAEILTRTGLLDAFGAHPHDIDKIIQYGAELVEELRERFHEDRPAVAGMIF
jgi:hypothetical protein